MKMISNGCIKYGLVLLVGITTTLVKAQITSIPDAGFEQELIDQGIDSDGIINGQVATIDIENILVFSMGGNEIQNIIGIQNFAALEEFSLELTNVTTIDLSQNINLTYFRSFINQEVTSISFPENAPLHTLVINHNSSLQTLDITNLTNIEVLEVGNQFFDTLPYNGFTTIDISNNSILKEFSCTYGRISSLNTSQNLNLEILILKVNPISIIDVSNNIALKHLDLGSNNLATLDVSEISDLEVLNLSRFVFSGLSNPNLTTLNVSNNRKLEVLDLSNSAFETVNAQNGTNNILTAFTFGSENLFCMQVDDPDAANNREFPYDSWQIAGNILFSEDCSLSVAETQITSLALYPNPVADKLLIQLNNNEIPALLRIYSINGTLVSETFNTNIINVSDLQSGMYFIEVVSENGKAIERFIKE